MGRMGESREVGGLYGMNVETLAGDKTLTPGDDRIYQYLDEGDADRIITLATAGAVLGDRFVIRHNGVYGDVHKLTVNQSPAFLLDEIYSGAIKEFIFDGTDWKSRGIGTGAGTWEERNIAIGRDANGRSLGVAIGYHAVGYSNSVAVGYSADGHTQGVAVGYQADGYTFGVAVGYQADGYTEGVAVGHSADGHDYGVAVGKDADGHTSGVAVGRDADGYSDGVAVGHTANGHTSGVAVGSYAGAYNSGVAVGRNAYGHTYGVALGRLTNTNAKKYSIALGFRSETERVGETSININGDDSDQENNVVQGRWEGETAGGAGATEIFCAGQTNERFLVRPSSVLAFTMVIVARDNVAGHVARYSVADGLIKRDAADNTVLVAATVVADYEDDAAWDVAVTGDDGNEALIITVTGDDTNPVQWAARADGVETHF